MMMPIKNHSLISLKSGALTCILTCISKSFTVSFNKENIKKKLSLVSLRSGYVVGVERGRGLGGREKGRGLGREGKGRLL